MKCECVWVTALQPNSKHAPQENYVEVLSVTYLKQTGENRKNVREQLKTDY
jgi:hypothetical protein